MKVELCQNQMGPGNMPDSSVIVISDEDDQDMENVSNNPPKIVSTTNYNTMISPHAAHYCTSGSEQPLQNPCILLLMLNDTCLILIFN